MISILKVGWSLKDLRLLFCLFLSYKVGKYKALCSIKFPFYFTPNSDKNLLSIMVSGWKVLRFINSFETKHCNIFILCLFTVLRKISILIDMLYICGCCNNNKKIYYGWFKPQTWPCHLIKIFIYEAYGPPEY